MALEERLHRLSTLHSHQASIHRELGNDLDRVNYFTRKQSRVRWSWRIAVLLAAGLGVVALIAAYRPGSSADVATAPAESVPSPGAAGTGEAGTVPVELMFSIAATEDADVTPPEPGTAVVARSDEDLANLWRDWGLSSTPAKLGAGSGLAVAFVVRDGPCLHEVLGLQRVGDAASVVWGPPQNTSCEDSLQPAVYVLGIPAGSLAGPIELEIRSPVRDVPLAEPGNVRPVIIHVSLQP